MNQNENKSDEDILSPDDLPEDLENFRVDTSEAEEALFSAYLEALHPCRQSLQLAYAAVLKAEGQLDAAIEQYLEFTRSQRSSLRRSVARGPEKGRFSNNLLFYRRHRGYLDLSWSEAKKGPFGMYYTHVKTTNSGVHMNALLAGAHASEVALLKAIELKAREFRRVDRELRGVKNQMENLLSAFGLLDGRSDPSRRRARK